MPPCRYARARACVRACVRACMRACMRACVRVPACVRACVRADAADAGRPTDARHGPRRRRLLPPPRRPLAPLGRAIQRRQDEHHRHPALQPPDEQPPVRGRQERRPAAQQRKVRPHLFGARIVQARGRVRQTIVRGGVHALRRREGRPIIAHRFVRETGCRPCFAPSSHPRRAVLGDARRVPSSACAGA